SRCTHLRERVAPAVARLLRRNCGLPIAGKNCRALRSSPPFPFLGGKDDRPATLFRYRDAKTFHPSRSSRCLFVRNSSADGTIKLAVEIGRDQLRWPAAGTQTESQFAAKRRLGHPQIVFGFAKKLSQPSRRISH